MADNPLARWLQEQEAAGDEVVGAGPEAPEAAAPGRDAGPADLWDLPAPDGPLRRPRRRLLLLALVPWVVVLGLAGAVVAAGGSPPPAGEAAPSAAPTIGADATPTSGAGLGATGLGAVDAPAEDTAPADAAAPAPEPAPTPARASSAEADDALLGRTAALEVRAALATPTADGTLRYVEDAVGGPVRRVGDAAVVAVRALVREGDAHGWRGARTSRWAVALSTGPDAALLAGPWPLAASTGAAAAPGAGPSPAPEPSEVPERVEAATAALVTAGYGAPTDVRVRADPAVPGVLRVEAVAVAPGATTPAPHHVWLTDDDPPEPLDATAGPD